MTQDAQPTDTYLTVRQVSDLLKVTTVSIRAWLGEGRLPGIRIGKEWRVRQRDLDDWIESRKVSAA